VTPQLVAPKFRQFTQKNYKSWQGPSSQNELGKSGPAGSKATGPSGNPVYSLVGSIHHVAI